MSIRDISNIKIMNEATPEKYTALKEKIDQEVTNKITSFLQDIGGGVAPETITAEAAHLLAREASVATVHGIHNANAEVVMFDMTAGSLDTFKELPVVLVELYNQVND